MGKILLIMGGILFPLGLYLLAEYNESTAAWIIALVAGLGFWIGSAWFFAREGREEWQQRRMEIKELREQRKELRELLVNMHKELKRLNQDKRDKDN